MSAVPLLGQNPPADTADDDAEMAVHTAFVVYQTPEGEWVGSNDPRYLAGLQINKVAHPDEMGAGAHSVDAQIQAARTSDRVVYQQLAMAQQAQQQAQQAAVLHKLQQQKKG
ncbi:hypothetical protein ACWDTT_16000 [Streptosporangium sandarakinum]